MLLHAAKLFFWVIGIMFFAGMIGSAVVVLLTSVEDVKELHADEKEPIQSFASPDVARAQPSL